MSPRILVFYGTTDGHTAKVANAIAAAPRALGADVDLANGAGSWDPDPRDYAAVIVAASVHAGTYQRLVRRWARALMRRIVAAAGGDTDTTRDYEYTDWTDLEEFAIRFLETHRDLAVADERSHHEARATHDVL